MWDAGPSLILVAATYTVPVRPLVPRCFLVMSTPTLRLRSCRVTVTRCPLVLTDAHSLATAFAAIAHVLPRCLVYSLVCRPPSFSPSLISRPVDALSPCSMFTVHRYLSLSSLSIQLYRRGLSICRSTFPSY